MYSVRRHKPVSAESVALHFSGGFAFMAFVLVGFALLHARKRLRALAFAMPAVTSIALPLPVSHWAAP